MIDVKCQYDPNENVFVFTALSEVGRRWFVDVLDAMPGDEVKATKEFSMSICKDMLKDGLMINSAAETDQFKERFHIRDDKPRIVEASNGSALDDQRTFGIPMDATMQLIALRRMFRKIPETTQKEGRRR